MQEQKTSAKVQHQKRWVVVSLLIALLGICFIVALASGKLPELFPSKSVACLLSLLVLYLQNDKLSKCRKIRNRAEDLIFYVALMCHANSLQESSNTKL